jgi:hypothetical protein
MSIIETRDAQFGENHANTLTNIGKLAGAYRKQGCLDEAEQLAMQVMETHKIVSGKVHPDTLLSMGMLQSSGNFPAKLQLRFI